MVWDIRFYETQRGEKIVKRFIYSQESRIRTKATHLLDLLEAYGPRLGMPYVKRITNNLYELRIRGKEEIRIFFSFKGSYIYLLHVFKKKTQKTPQKEINIALQRLDKI